jgi:hypothetical protein
LCRPAPILSPRIRARTIGRAPRCRLNRASVAYSPSVLYGTGRSSASARRSARGRLWSRSCIPFWRDPLQRRVLEPLHPGLVNVHIAGTAVAHDRNPSSSRSGSRARMNEYDEPSVQQVVLEADHVEPLDNAVPDHFADGRRRCAASQGRGDDGGQGASRRDHWKSRAQGANADERPEHDGGNARDIIPDNHSRRGRPGASAISTGSR